MDPEPRDLRRELNQALRRCTPKQRKWLYKVRECAGQKWAALYQLGYSTTALRKWLRDERTHKVLALQAEIAAMDSDITRERQLREYGRIAFAKMDDFRGPDGRRKPFKDWGEDQCAAVSEVEFDAAGNVTRVKLHRKGGAQDALARITGVLVDRRELTGRNGGPLLIQDTSNLTDEQLEAIARGGGAPPTEPPKGEK